MKYNDAYEASKANKEHKQGESIQARSRRGAFVEHWWAERWIKSLEMITDAGRLRRGRSYARNGHVIAIQEKKGKIQASVQGSRPTPYRVTIALEPLNTEQWEAVFDALSERAIFTAQLLAGEMPNEVEEAFTAAGVALLPTTSVELETNCTCPDWANPCKHVAAVHYILGEQFDEDPFLIFRLRGCNQEQLLAALRQRRETNTEGAPSIAEISAPYSVAEKSAPLTASLTSFWQMGQALEHFPTIIQPPAQPYPVLRRLGPPSFAKNLEASLMPAYEAMTQEALRVAFANDAADTGAVQGNDGSIANRTRRVRGGSMSLHQTLMENYTSEVLADFVKMCAAFNPSKEKLTRKDQRAAYVVQTLLNPQFVAQLWATMDDLSQKALAAAYHNGGEFAANSFAAQYGALPPRPSTSAWYYKPPSILIDLFIHQGTIPPELMALLAPHVPPPDRFQVVGVEDIKDAINVSDDLMAYLRVVETEASGWHDLLLCLQLCDQEALKFNSTGSKLTPTSVAKIIEKLLQGDFLHPADYKVGFRWTVTGAKVDTTSDSKLKPEDAIRPIGLMNFARGAGLITAYDRAGLTERGRAILARQEPELLLDAFETWTQSNNFDEITRIDAIKGLRSRDIRLTKPAFRRERIVEALSWCPVNQWISISEFFRALKVWQFEFYLEEGGIARLYIADHYGGGGYYGGWGSYQDMWLLTSGLYIKAIICEYLAAIGALDIAYVPPGLAIREVSDYVDFDEDYFSRYDGLMYFRINPLGAYLFGQAGDYSAVTSADTPLLQIEASRLLTFVDPARATPVVRSQLEQIAVPEGEGGYRLDAQKILLALSQGVDLEDWRNFLTRNSANQLPPEVNRWLSEIFDASRAFEITGRLLQIRATSDDLVKFVLADAELGKFCKVLGPRDLVIPANRELRFRNRLRDLGYGIQ